MLQPTGRCAEGIVPSTVLFALGRKLDAGQLEAAEARRPWRTAGERACF